MENLGDTDVVNPWLSNGRNKFRTVEEIVASAVWGLPRPLPRSVRVPVKLLIVCIEPRPLFPVDSRRLHQVRAVSLAIRSFFSEMLEL
jgi:hypothetical protein